MSAEDTPPLADAEWPTFGWSEDVRPALAAALRGRRSVALATLFRVEGSAPRGPGVQMLFDGANAVGYFSGGCVEADVARHAAAVIGDGRPRTLHYGLGSPWVDIKLKCGGAIYIFIERIAPDSVAAHELLAHRDARTPALWVSDGNEARAETAFRAPLLQVSHDPLTIARRYDPRWRLVVSGWDPTALAIAKLGVDAQFETFLLRPNGPDLAPPVEGLTYLRRDPRAALEALGPDAWTAFVGAAHESDLDIPACAFALAAGEGYVGLVGAASRVAERKQAMIDAGAPSESLARLHAPAGMMKFGKAPWRIAIGVIAEIVRTTSEERERV